MKKIFLILMLAGVTISASAQKETGWFFGAGAGMNFGFDGRKFEDRPTSHNGAGYAGDFYAGGWINPTFGLRAGYQGFGISDRYTDFGNRRFGYAHADLLMRAHRNIIPYVHGGMINIVNPSWGAGAGRMFPIHLTRNISIVPDLKASALNSKAYGNDQNNVSAVISATVGLAFRFGNKTRRAAVVPAAPAPDTVIVKEIIKDTVVVKEVVQDTVYVKPELPAELATISALALFDVDKSDLRAEALPELDAVVKWFASHPSAKATIEGHTDSTASAEYNQKLSERRAKAVFDYLVGHGIDAGRLSHAGYGLTRPVASNATPEGRQQNRRVEIKVK